MSAPLAFDPTDEDLELLIGCKFLWMSSDNVRNGFMNKEFLVTKRLRDLEAEWMLECIRTKDGVRGSVRPFMMNEAREKVIWLAVPIPFFPCGNCNDLHRDSLDYLCRRCRSQQDLTYV